MSSEELPWIWTADTSSDAQSYVRFRQTFEASPETAANLRISADSRYWVWINGAFLGHGPARNWPGHWEYDTYKVSLRERNVVCVLVHRLAIGTFQYLPSPPGLTVSIATESTLLAQTDADWQCSPSPSLAARAPRLAIQQGYEEQFDARLEDDWLAADFDDASWARAIPIASPHGGLEPRSIPLLASEEVRPAAILGAETVSPLTETWSIDVRRFLWPEDGTARPAFARGFLSTQIWSPEAQSVTIVRPHYHNGVLQLNGENISGLGKTRAEKFRPVRLREGWNSLLIPFPSYNDQPGSAPARTHAAQIVLGLRSATPLRWACRGDAGGSPWGFLGPFDFDQAELAFIEKDRDFPRLMLPAAEDPTGRASFDAVWRDGGASATMHEIADTYLAHTNVFVSAYGDEPIRLHPVASENGSLQVAPSLKNEDVRILLDFGREVLGCHEFEVEAAAGTILDFHSFESLHPDGTGSFLEGLNNSFRYVCREGRQSYRSLLRRGFRYTHVIVRNFHTPVRFTSLAVDFVGYPQTRQGHFTCSDPLLEQIWEVGAHTLRCCAEDTYTDCPSFEQVLWVGDARNEALVDWVVNGDHRLWLRCLRLAGQSLERGDLPLTASQVPSGWTNLIPAWSFLWMRSCCEYLLWTGDYAGARDLLPWIEQNVAGIARHIDRDGLFSIQAYNLLDWAGMDTPTRGVVTHNNAFAVQGLRDAARFAAWLDRPDLCTRFTTLAESLTTAVNTHLWDDARGAYLDSIHEDGRRSAVFSEQTQAAVLLSGLATGERADRCAAILRQTPEGFVRSGSPFFEFFRLEILFGRTDTGNEPLDAIRRNWAPMLAQGATTFWEMWSRPGTVTRSHCHGWSAAPTFFLSSAVLGVRPLEPGFRTVRIDPRLGDLTFAEGSVPTPHGPIRLRVERLDGTVVQQVTLPEGVRRA